MPEIDKIRLKQLPQPLPIVYKNNSSTNPFDKYCNSQIVASYPFFSASTPHLFVAFLLQLNVI